ncbi:MAG TPA: protease pro-enzyme activation domain-containing protein, partial [Candidatus Acidoferrum sp.]
MPPQSSRFRLSTSERAPLSGAKLVGPADPKEKMEVTIFLRRGSKPNTFPQVSKLGALPPQERHHLSREEFATNHAALPEDVAKVRRFASEFGLQVKEENPARRSVVLAGTVEAFSRAFEVKLDRYEHPTKGSYRGRTGTLTIPSELSDAVEGVFGLDDRPQAKPHFRIRPKSTGQMKPHVQQASYDPTLVAQAYSFP